MAYILLMWTITDVLPTAVFAVTVGYVADPPAGATAAQRELGWLALVVVSAITAGLWYAAWRQATRACRRRIGLRVRGWRRVRDVAFADVLDVRDTQYLSAGRAFAFAHTLVTYRDSVGTRTVVVAAHFHGGQQDTFQILTWLPADHPLRAKLPPGLRTATELPAGVSGVVRPEARPAMSSRSRSPCCWCRSPVAAWPWSPASARAPAAG